jgi:hypothetical protein
VTPIKYHEAAEVELLNEIGYLELRAKGLGREPHRTVLGIGRGDSTGHPEAPTPEIPVLTHLFEREG